MPYPAPDLLPASDLPSTEVREVDLPHLLGRDRQRLAVLGRPTQAVSTRRVTETRTPSSCRPVLAVCAVPGRKRAPASPAAVSEVSVTAMRSTKSSSRFAVRSVTRLPSMTSAPVLSTSAVSAWVYVAAEHHKAARRRLLDELPLPRNAAVADARRIELGGLPGWAYSFRDAWAPRNGPPTTSGSRGSTIGPRSSFQAARPTTSAVTRPLSEPPRAEGVPSSPKSRSSATSARRVAIDRSSRGQSRTAACAPGSRSSWRAREWGRRRPAAGGPRASGAARSGRGCRRSRP